jgi:hypothetical protein
MARPKAYGTRFRGRRGGNGVTLPSAAATACTHLITGAERNGRALRQIESEARSGVRAEGHRVEAARRALPFETVTGLDQGQEPR